MIRYLKQYLASLEVSIQSQEVHWSEKKDEINELKQNTKWIEKVKEVKRVVLSEQKTVLKLDGFVFHKNKEDYYRCSCGVDKEIK